MQIDSKYKTKNGRTLRTVVQISECGRFVHCRLNYHSTFKCGFKWYFKNARQLEKEIKSIYL